MAYFVTPSSFTFLELPLEITAVIIEYQPQEFVSGTGEFQDRISTNMQKVYLPLPSHPSPPSLRPLLEDFNYFLDERHVHSTRKPECYDKEGTF